MKKLHKMMKAFAVCVALALVFCMIPVGSVYAETNAGTGNGSGNGSENGENGGTPSENPETVQVTIDNTNSHVGVRFYQDTNNVEEIDETDTFKWIAPGTNETISVQKDAKARIRVYIQANGYYIPEDYHIDGVEKITNDNKVGWGWCRAAFEVTADQDKTIKISEAKECPENHSTIQPNLRWGYNDQGDGTHAAFCETCSTVLDHTIGKHEYMKMTLSEYVNWYYTDGDYYAGADPEKDLAPMMKSMLEYYEKQEGLTADTVANFCKICGAVEKLPVQETPATDNKADSSTSSTTSSQPAPTPAPAVQQPAAVETPVSQPVTAALADAEGVLPTGAAITAATVTSGAAYEKAVEVIKAQVSGLGEFSVMGINLTDAANTQVHQLNGYVQVSVPMPANITVKEGKAIVVYRLEDDGTLTRCDTTVENGVITFKTNHFSTYIVAEEDVTAVTSPKTEDVSAGINLIFCMGILLAGAAAVAMKRKMA